MPQRQLTVTPAIVMASLLAAAVLAVSTGCEREEFDAETAFEESEEPVDRSDQYTTRGEETTVDVGEESEVKLLVLPGPDLKINDEFPWAIEFDEVEGLEVKTPKMRWADMELRDEQATIPVSVVAEEAGEYTLSGKADFSVCNDDRCDFLRNEPVELLLEAR